MKGNMKFNYALLLVLFSAMYFQEVLCGSCHCSVKYQPVGCYNDKKDNRSMSDYIMTDRDPRIEIFSGIKVNWNNFIEYLPDFVCRCARKAQEKGFQYFGVQYFGECWSSSDAPSRYNIHGEYDASTDEKDVRGCVSTTYKPCNGKTHCVGRKWTNYVYKLTSTCEEKVMAVGCFIDKKSRAMPDYITNDRDKSINNFSGTRINWPWYDSYLQGDFLCRCAKLAKERGYRVFGLQYYGECWGSSNAVDTYFKYNEGYSRCRNTCYQECLPSSQYCVGQNWRNFVYRFATSVEDCAVPNNPVGCYASLSGGNYQLLITDADPAHALFSGYSHIDLGAQTLEERFPELACSCAFKAHEKGYEYIALKTDGSCYGTNDFGSTTSSSCHSDFEETQSCADDATTKCGGGEDAFWIISVATNAKRNAILQKEDSEDRDEIHKKRSDFSEKFEEV